MNNNQNLQNLTFFYFKKLALNIKIKYRKYLYYKIYKNIYLSKTFKFILMYYLINS
jgi:hypothetical protein